MKMKNGGTMKPNKIITISELINGHFRLRVGDKILHLTERELARIVDMGSEMIQAEDVAHSNNWLYR